MATTPPGGTTVVVPADLRATVSVAGNHRTFTTTVTNLGPGTAQAVRIEYRFRKLPASLPSACTANAVARTVVCSLGQVAAGQRPQLTMTAPGVADLIGLRVVSATTDLVPTNNEWQLSPRPIVLERTGGSLS